MDARKLLEREREFQNKANKEEMDVSMLSLWILVLKSFWGEGVSKL